MAAASVPTMEDVSVRIRKYRSNQGGKRKENEWRRMWRSEAGLNQIVENAEREHSLYNSCALRQLATQRSSNARSNVSSQDETCKQTRDAAIIKECT